MSRPTVVRVALEQGTRRTFASAVDWPGWTRAGRDDAAALDALAAYAAATAAAPAELRKGPRGGGRDTAAIVAHEADAAAAYARKMGVPSPAKGGPREPVDVRAAILETVRSAAGPPSAGAAWPVRYGVRRTAWHALDHLWEVEDRSGPSTS